MARKRNLLEPVEGEEENVEENENVEGEDVEANLEESNVEKPDFTAEAAADIPPSVDALDNRAEGAGETIPAGNVVPDVQLQVVEAGSIAHGPIENFAVQERPNQRGLVEDVRAEEGELQEDEPGEARFVRFVLDAGPNIGEVRPALVTRSWNGGEMLNLLVFCDTDEETRHNDRIGQILWRPSVPQGDKDTVGSYF